MGSATTSQQPPVKPYATLLLWSAVCASYGVLLWPSLSSMNHIWWQSANYTHGPLIPLISAWLLYRQRQQLLQLEQRVWWPAIVPLLAIMLLWLLGRSGDLRVVEHLASALTLISLVLFIGGRELFTATLFPLGYLLFAVPMGEQLVPWLQQITAAISVHALQWTGIPVFLNGLFIEIPSGKFHVAEACSGMRYLTASLAIGTLFAYLSYTSLLKRLLFCGVAVLVAIAANGVRAYLTIIIAHVTDLQYGVGDVYHFVAGWTVYAVIMLLLFWIGSHWNDTAASNPTPHSPQVDRWRHLNSQMNAVLCSLLIFGVTGLLEYRIQHLPLLPPLQPLTLEVENWEEQPPSTDWSPIFKAPDRSYRQAYRDPEGNLVDLFIADYQGEHQDKELINQRNVLQKKGIWTVARRSTHSFSTGQEQISVGTREIRHVNGARRELWYWYQIGEQITASQTEAKLYQALYGITLQAPLSRIVVLSAPLQFEHTAETTLENFVQHNWPQLLNRDLSE